MDYERIEKYLARNPIRKIKKTIKIKLKLAHVNKKTQARKLFYIQALLKLKAINVERKSLECKEVLKLIQLGKERIQRCGVVFWKNSLDSANKI